MSIINQETWRRLFRNYKLQTTSTQLTGYDGKPIKALNTVSLSVQHEDQPASQFQPFVTTKRSNLMGVDLFDHLGFSIATQLQVPVLTLGVVKITRRWPSLFLDRELRELDGYAHEPRMDPMIPPVIQRCRRLPPALRDEVSAELKRLQAQGIIEPIDSSPWISNLLVVRKKTGSIQLCVDLREVNKAVTLDKYPLPTVDELGSQFHSSKVFSKLDLSQGYLQIPLTEKGRNMTAFVSHDGIFRFKRMPFGLSSAPSSFQKIMVSTLAGSKGFSVYMDDIVVHGATQEEHDRRLSAVLDSLQNHNVTLNSTKCVFGSEEVQFLEFRVSSNDIHSTHSVICRFNFYHSSSNNS